MDRRAHPGRGHFAVLQAALSMLLLASLYAAPARPAVAAPSPSPAPQAAPGLPGLTFTRQPFTTANTLMAVGDLTGDGNLDLITEVSDRSALLPGDGRGGLLAAQPFGQAGALYSDAAVGDLDGDGDLDVVVARRGFRLFGIPPVPAAVYRNDGAGGLTLAGTVGPPIDVNAPDVALGDVDGDGDLDLFYYVSSTGGSIWLNDGAGGFANERPAPFPEDLGDVDGDGDLDLLAAGSLRLGDGAGGFESEGLASPFLAQAALGDIDGDGDLDIVGADAADAKALLRNTGGGVFGAPEPFGQSEAVTKVALGDLDGDGDLDAVYGTFRQTTSIYVNDGAGVMSGPLRFGEADFVTDLALADLDHDGALDVLTLGDQGYLYRNSGGAFGLARPIGVRDNFAPVASGDLNGDGAPDLVSGNAEQQPTYFLSDGAGGYLAPRQLPGEGLPPAADRFTNTSRAIAVADLNGDGDQDIVVSRYQAASSVYLGDGAGNFPTVRAFGGPGERILALEAADVDLDGDRDLVTGQGSCESAVATPNKIFLNDGQAGFAATLTFGSAGRSADVAVADMNGDGRPDLIAAGGYCQLSGQSYVFMADGAGGFGPGVPFGPPADWSTVAPLDADGDGDLDLAAGGAAGIGGGGNLGGRLYLNDGGTFAQERIVAATRLITRLDAADFDGDGDADLLASGSLSALLLNDGAGAFAPGADLGVALPDSRSVADFDGDGDQDMFLGSRDGASRIYRNTGAGAFTPDPGPLGRSTTLDTAALGDLDGDGDLDLVASDAIRNLTQVFLGDGAGGFSTGASFGRAASATLLGDLNGDGDLDMVGLGQASAVYLGDGAGGFGAGRAIAGLAGEYRAALGDLDGDGDLDLALGSSFGRPSIMRNDGAGGLGAREFLSALTTSTPPALGDLDGDGDLDMALGRGDGSASIALNDGGGRFSAGPPVVGPLNADDVALGDVDGDGDLDLVASGANQPATAFFNDGAGTFTARQPFGLGGRSSDLALGDLDGDGDLDALTGTVGGTSEGGLFVRYLNDGAGSFAPGRAFGLGTAVAQLALGDLNRDGLLDLVSAQGSQQSYTYLNRGGIEARLPASPPAVSLGRPGVTADAPGLSSAELLTSAEIAIPFRLSDRDGDPVARIAASFSLDGGGSWRPAVPVSGTLLANLPTRGGPGCDAGGCAYTYRWDTFASGLFGVSDRVIFRLVAFPGQGLVGGDQGRPAASAATNPFRVRGTQVRVLAGDQPAPGATVYRLRSGLSLGGAPVGAGPTAADGFLPGRGELGLGDRLFAIAPLTSTGTFTVYATSGAPTAQGVESLSVASPGVQTLRVAPERPLILFDLLVAVEWDASRSPGYLDELSFNLRQASRYLYDFSDGQIALGAVTVSQRADDWAAADVVVQANNRIRPFATQGGVVITTTVDPERPEIVYEPGQVRMGATWNRYGTPGQSLGEDWALILAHELSHYLLFLDDAYLGLNDDGLLIPVSTCTGTAMGDLYTDPGASEFIYDQAFWDANCAQSLGARSLGRTEWATITLWYPWLKRPTATNPGPATMPFELTTVRVEPITDSLAIDDPSFLLDYAGGAISSSEARAFLLRDDQYVFDLGSPFGGQNRLIAYGARPGDRLCVFDRPRAQFGCEAVALGDDRLSLRQDPAWDPLVRLTPVTSTTLALTVENVPPGLELRARLFPEFGEALPAVALGGAGSYSASFPLDDLSLAGSLQLWVEEPSAEEAPRRETIVTYATAGNPGIKRAGGGIKRAGGGIKRAGGGIKRAGGGIKRAGGAPVVSPDGQLIFFTPNPAAFAEGQLYTIQSMAGLPPLPAGKLVVGQGYSLVATPGSPTLGGSVSFQYLPNDALVAGVREEELTVHYHNGQTWEALATTRSPYFNLASAPSRGPGVYALLAGASAPAVTAVSPPTATAGQPLRLAIGGSGFLPPATVTLSGAGAVYTATVLAATATTLEAELPGGLPAAEYRLTVRNGDGSAAAPVAFAVYPPSAARFADAFESGAGRWTLTGEWGLVPLPAGGGALTDSPGANYLSAAPGARRVTTATSAPFSLAGLSQPELRIRHSYVLAVVGSSRDVGRVEISTDGGASWATLATFSGGGIYGAGVAALGDEWVGAIWQEERISLAGYSGTAQLRLSLEVDGAAADRGWVLDDLSVGEASGPTPAARVYLPLVVR